jgi:site-specific recombinase XerD
MADRCPLQASTCRSLIADRGIDLKAIAEIAGHSRIRTTAVYVEPTPRRLVRLPAGRDVVSAADFPPELD